MASRASSSKTHSTDDLPVSHSTSSFSSGVSGFTSDSTDTSLDSDDDDVVSSIMTGSPGPGFGSSHLVHSRRQSTDGELEICGEAGGAVSAEAPPRPVDVPSRAVRCIVEHWRSFARRMEQRRRLSRNLFARFTAEHDRLQRAFAGVLPATDDVMKRSIAAEKVQAWWRAHARHHRVRAKQRLAVQRHSAAMTIQSSWRLYKRRRRIRHKTLLHSAALDLQCACRAYASTAITAVLWRREQRRVGAVRLVQAVCRMQLAMRTAQRVWALRRQQEGAAVAIQSVGRSCLATRMVGVRRGERAAALRIQAACRALASLRVAALRGHRLAVLTVQAACRGYLTDRLAQQKRYQRHAAAASCVERAWRAHAARARAARYRMSCAVMIQTEARAQLSAVLVSRHRHRVAQWHAAVAIQRLWRGHFGPRRAAAIALQRLWRGFRSRVRLGAYLRFMAFLNEHATRIQARWRGHHQRRWDRLARQAVTAPGPDTERGAAANQDASGTGVPARTTRSPRTPVANTLQTSSQPSYFETSRKLPGSAVRGTTGAKGPSKGEPVELLGDLSASFPDWSLIQRKNGLRRFLKEAISSTNKELRGEVQQVPPTLCHTTLM